MIFSAMNYYNPLNNLKQLIELRPCPKYWDYIILDTSKLICEEVGENIVTTAAPAYSFVKSYCLWILWVNKQYKQLDLSFNNFRSFILSTNKFRILFPFIFSHFITAYLFDCVVDQMNVTDWLTVATFCNIFSATTIKMQPLQ